MINIILSKPFKFILLALTALSLSCGGGDTAASTTGKEKPQAEEEPSKTVPKKPKKPKVEEADQGDETGAGEEGTEEGMVLRGGKVKPSGDPTKKKPASETTEALLLKKVAAKTGLDPETLSSALSAGKTFMYLIPEKSKQKALPAALKAAEAFLPPGVDDSVIMNFFKEVLGGKVEKAESDLNAATVKADKARQKFTEAEAAFEAAKGTKDEAKAKSDLKIASAAKALAETAQDNALERLEKIQIGELEKEEE